VIYVLYSFIRNYFIASKMDCYINILYMLEQNRLHVTFQVSINHFSIFNV